jgi:hypothetical protein
MMHLHALYSGPLLAAALKCAASFKHAQPSLCSAFLSLACDLTFLLSADIIRSF